MKFLFKAKSFFIFMFLFLSFFLSGFYIYYLYEYLEPHDTSYLLKYYPTDLILYTGANLGLPGSRLQHFLNFSTKSKNTIRIGTFGDSFTFGDEVKKTGSFPYQLQKLFNQKFPNKKVEILNFGISGTSFQEQFFLWKKYAKSYSLDYILIGPRGLYIGRGLTFSKNWDWKYFGYPKTRFILSKKQDKLKRIHIKGNTLKERYRNYYTLIPSLTALRYDKKPFQMWEKLFSKLRHNIPNPFYYIKILDEEESVKINTLLLEKIKNLYNKKILFFTDKSSQFTNYRHVEKSHNLNYFHFEGKGGNRFYKVFVHKSSLGNEIVAKVYFNALIGKKHFFLKIINCHFKEVAILAGKLQKHKTKKFNKDLSAIQSIQLTDGNNVIATLRHNSSDHYYRDGSYFNYRIKGTKSLIAFFSQSDFLNSPFIPLPIQLKEGMKIYTVLTDNTRVELGLIKALDTYKKLFVFYEDFIEGSQDQVSSTHKSYFLLKKMPSLFKRQIENSNKPIRLFVGGYKLGELQLYDLYGEKALKFIPMHGYYRKSFLMMGDLSGYIRERQFSTEFPLYIQYNMENGEIFKSLIPEWKCKKEKQAVHLNLPNFEPINLY